MRKIFTFLAGVFVCALVATNALGQSQEINSASQHDQLASTTASPSVVATSQLGRSVLVRVISPNGVNTAVTVTDVANGRQFVPLVVQYPIVKSGNITETAYYTSAHPALLSAEVISTGNMYVTTMLETAA